MVENYMETGRYDLQVYAVVALLDDPTTAKVKSIWSHLEVECGLKAVNATPFPHFSFHIAQSYDLDELDARLSDIASQTGAFRVRTTGLSVFTGLEPVVFIPLVVSQTLLSLHQKLWDETSSLGERVSGHYRPEYWVPHITLANRDVHTEGLACITRLYAARSFLWEIEVSKLAVICQKGSVGEIFRTFTLGEG